MANTRGNRGSEAPRPLRRPGRVTTEQPELEEAKLEYLDALVDIMQRAQVVQFDSKASMQEYTEAYKRRAEKVLRAAEVATIKRALMTATELEQFCQARHPPVELHDVGEVVLESFIWNHAA